MTKVLPQINHVGIYVHNLTEVAEPYMDVSWYGSQTIGDPFYLSLSDEKILGDSESRMWSDPSLQRRLEGAAGLERRMKGAA